MPFAPPRRPDPDRLLAHVQAQESRVPRGHLKIFFGAAPGVGKTFAMLAAARLRRLEGVDVIIGVVETHGRAETARLLEGIEQIPRRAVPYHNTSLLEFDLDGAMKRRPGLVLVDELAHTNAPGSRHEKRWQDVDELLIAGIDVYTTLNVQHIESLTDVVAVITGVVVHETVPDTILEQADDVELVDLPPAELVRRLRDGKVYVPEQAGRALENFFRPGNLSALRELALRRTAERVDAQMRSYMRDHAIGSPWPTAERLLVCVPRGAVGPRLVRSGRRMASRLRAEWHVVHVERPADLRLEGRDGETAAQALGLAEQLGAETAVLDGDDVADEVLNYVRQHNISRIILGKPKSRRLGQLFSSAADNLIRRSGPVDVWVISGERSQDEEAESIRWRPSSTASAYLGGAGVTVATSLVCWTAHHYLALPNLAMIYLLGVVVAALRWGRGSSTLCAFLSVAAFDFFFVPPRFTLTVEDGEYVFTFIVMLMVGLTISALTTRVRRQAVHARERERHTRALYAMSREFVTVTGPRAVADIAVRHVQEVFEAPAVLLLPGRDGQLETAAGSAELAGAQSSGEGVARWVFDNGRRAGRGTATLPGTTGLFLPLATSARVIGVLGVGIDAARALSPDLLHRIETFANQAGLMLERSRLVGESESARLEVETERLRNALLSSVSHDLRTPLASITGAASSLLHGGAQLSETTRSDLVHSIYCEAARMNRQVANLLDMARLDAGALELQREWHSLEEIVGTALNRLEEALGGRESQVRIPEDLQLVHVDGILIEQVVFNLLENALKYSPPGSPVEVSAAADEQFVRLIVADSGRGLEPGTEERIFDKFYRTPAAGREGIGLGLAICRGFVEAHGGQIRARNRRGQGAEFELRLPLETPPPLPRVSE